jgi:hypothetical protein
VTLAGLTDAQAFYVGVPTGYLAVGVLLNEQSIRLFDDQHPGFILNEQPATVAMRGRLAYQTFDTNFAGALAAPAVGCRIVYNKASGVIGLLAAGAAIPATHAQLQAAITTVTPWGPPLKAVILDLFMPVAS